MAAWVCIPQHLQLHLPQAEYTNTRATQKTSLLSALGSHPTKRLEPYQNDPLLSAISRPTQCYISCVNLYNKPSYR